MDVSGKAGGGGLRRLLARAPVVGRFFRNEIDGRDFTPVEGLPGLLPRGEKLLWQGRPHWFTLARTAFFGDWVAIYFGALAAWRVTDGFSAGASPDRIAAETAGLAVMAVVCLGLIGLVAWATARAAVYTLTSRRLVMRVGAALPVTLNLPFRQIANVAMKSRGDRGDIAVSPAGEVRIAYLMLMPHARPWRFMKPQPMLRAVPDAHRVARLMGEAIAAVQAEEGLAGAPATTRPAKTPATDARTSGGRSGGLIAAE
ncbi:photosynthetic complex putative assembly protein PuhB [Rubrimonas cliftonensis]|uniref:PH domain-containing protein n=1 Tax=Rubrimonas cliftonensis TaxID=89524 RepID=A0A1H4AD58_9RHOB|nr:photosynthetic complex putative assembly protein PuhB [Rubrimonas cliftonensis]SEA33909.1 PH domain-containing protein [Rubrimonas cliftonensis]